MLSILDHVVPDMIEVLERRFEILDYIDQFSPIGRRALSVKLHLTERVLRNEVEILKEQHLILSSKTGMSLTPLGEQILVKLKDYLGDRREIRSLEQKLTQVLAIEHCTVVPGDSDDLADVLKQMAKKTAEIIDALLDEGRQIISVMGGSTMKEVAHQIPSEIGHQRDLLFVPARGGLGEESTLEANVIAAKLADQVGGKSRSLYAPDHVHQEIYEHLINEPDIKKTLELIEQSNLLIYSIGEPELMAKRRQLSQESIDYIMSKKPVAEAFGEFIDEEGRTVHKLFSIGMQLKSLNAIPNIIVVAGGKRKAQAIIGHLKTVPSHTWLVTDGAAAKEILKGATL